MTCVCTLIPYRHTSYTHNIKTCKNKNPLHDGLNGNGLHRSMRDVTIRRHGLVGRSVSLVGVGFESFPVATEDDSLLLEAFRSRWRTLGFF